MKLCLSIEIQEGMSYADSLAMTRTAEELGFDSALLAEHYYPSGPLEQYPEGPGGRVSADAWIYLAGLARETRTIRLGTLVSPVTFRHPVVLAKMAATLDQLSDGRAELGIGAGWLEAEHHAYGFDYPEGPRRVDLVEEQLQVINGLFTQQPFSHHGAAYTLDQAHFTPRPVQQPRPTIIVGGRTTSQRLARLAARYADEFVIGQPTPDEVRQVRQRLDAACTAAGRAPDAVRLSVFVPIAVGRSAAEVDRHLMTYRQTNPQYVRMMDNLSTWLLGTPDVIADQLADLSAARVARVLVSVNCDLHREMLPLLAEAAAATPSPSPSGRGPG
jgi:alkanesulfonate monooxygenase SsuD/methylene tetrahydromethanopterin reductase-like flavin-dependent oxidoreductase (luciferase family)